MGSIKSLFAYTNPFTAVFDIISPEKHNKIKNILPSHHAMPSLRKRNVNDLSATVTKYYSGAGYGSWTNMNANLMQQILNAAEPSFSSMASYTRNQNKISRNIFI